MNNEALNDGVAGKKHTSPAGRRFGWKPGLPNKHSYPKFSAVHKEVVEIPPSIDLVEEFPYRFDQADSSSCTANAGCYIMGFNNGIKTLDDAYSRLFYYYNERLYENDVDQDGGASISDGVLLLATRGVCKEKTWAFDLKNNLYTKPSVAAYQEALTHKIHSKSLLESRTDYRQCLAKKMPFTIGITCFETLDSDLVTRTGILMLPGTESKPTGGHAVTVIGYTTDFHNTEVFQKSGLLPQQFPYPDCYHVLNSWGSNWGDKGTFWVPASYIDSNDISSDGQHFM